MSFLTGALQLRVEPHVQLMDIYTFMYTAGVDTVKPLNSGHSGYGPIREVLPLSLAMMQNHV